MSATKGFGARLAQERREKAVRERRDISLADVAKAVGSSSPSVSRWERGGSPPGDAIMEKLAKYFGVTPAWLRYGQEPRERVEPTPEVKPETHHDEVQVAGFPKRQAKPGKGRGGSGRRAG